MDAVSKKENSSNWRLFYQHFKELVYRINAEYIVDHLFSKRVISADEYREFIDTSRPRHQRSGKLLSLLPERCCLDTFLESIDEAYPDLQQKLAAKSTVNLPKAPARNKVDERNSARFAVFAEKLKHRVLDGNTKDHIKTFEEWVSKLRVSLQKCTIISRKQMIADYCFILLDTMCVIQRTHSKNKDILWKNRSFSYLRSLIADCSNPELAQIKYYARYAMALLYADKLDDAKGYIDEAIYRLGKYLPGREVGNCYFVRVNLNLKRYTKHPSKDLKMEIIRDAERGFSFFRDDEDSEMRIKWWNVYIDKKLFCNLGIGLLLEDIPLGGDTLHDYDEDEITGLLGEMRRYLHNIDKRRTMHYYKAEAKFYELKGEIFIAEGFLKEALKIAKESEFKQEYVNLHESIRRITPDYDGKNNKKCDVLRVNTNSECDNNNMLLQIEDTYGNKDLKIARDNDALDDACCNDVLAETCGNDKLPFYDWSQLETAHCSNIINLDVLCLDGEGNFDNEPSRLTDMFLAEIETPTSKMDSNESAKHHASDQKNSSKNDVLDKARDSAMLPFNNNSGPLENIICGNNNNLEVLFQDCEGYFDNGGSEFNDTNITVQTNVYSQMDLNVRRRRHQNRSERFQNINNRHNNSSSRH